MFPFAIKVDYRFHVLSNPARLDRIRTENRIKIVKTGWSAMWKCRQPIWFDIKLQRCAPAFICARQQLNASTADRGLALHLMLPAACRFQASWPGEAPLPELTECSIAMIRAGI